MSESTRTHKPFNCPECGVEIPATKSIYAHAITCMNIPDKGIKQTLDAARTRNDLHGERLIAMMEAASGRNE